MSTPFETFLLELAKVLNFSTLAPDPQGACLIIMKDGDTSLLFEFDDQLVPNTVLLSSPIAPIPIINRIDVYEAALIGNTSIEDTLSVKPDEDVLYLHRRLHPLMQATDIEQLIRIFLETIEQWKGRIATITTQPSRETFTPFPSAIQVFPNGKKSQ